MKWKALGFAVVAASLLCRPCGAQVGESMPPAKSLHGFANTQARQLGDFAGRLLLIEYFAYW